jgi:hypothetical protein
MLDRYKTNRDQERTITSEMDGWEYYTEVENQEYKLVRQKGGQTQVQRLRYCHLHRSLL